MTFSINKNLTINTYLNIQNPVSDPAWNKLSYLTPVELTPPVKSKPSLNADSAKVKTIVQDAVVKYWGVYQQKFPEAFAMNKALKTATPEIVFLNTKEDIDKETADTFMDQSETNAFTRPQYPNRVYLHVPNMIKKLNKFGDDALRATIAHELMHNLMNAMNKRVGTDSKGITETYKGVKNQLKDGFVLLPDGRKDQILQSSIENLLIEGGADQLSIGVTGIKSSHAPYQSYRDLSAQLEVLVGKETYRKAYISNDAVAYKTLVQAAVKLAQGYNEISDKKRISDVVSEFNKTNFISINVDKLDPNHVALLVKKYRAEILLIYNLYPNEKEIKKYDLTFSRAIIPDLEEELIKKKMLPEEATDKDIETAIRAVWKRNHPSK